MFEQMLSVVYGTFGQQATINGKTITVIKDSELLPYGELIQILDNQHVFNVKESDLPERPRRGDIITMNETDYMIERVLPTVRSGEYALLVSYGS